MIPVLYPATERTFANNGLGGLPDAASCVITEKRNTPGGYFLEMEYPVDGLHYGDIAIDRIIYATPSAGKHPQPFRIERISRPINGIVSIYAPHVSSALLKLVTSGEIVTASTAEALQYLVSRLVPTVERDKWSGGDTGFVTATTRHMLYPYPVQMMDALMGMEGSLLDKYGGEYEFDHWTIKLYRARGRSTGIEVRYGVNMADMNAETDASEIVTAVLPYWKSEIDGTEQIVIGNQCTAPTATSFAHRKCIALDVTSDFENSETAPTVEQVTARGQAFIDSTATTNVSMSLDTKYIPITDQIGERNVNLCDTVTVTHPDLGVSDTAKVVEVQFNPYIEKNVQITIGNIRRNAADTIAAIIKNTGNQKILW